MEVRQNRTLCRNGISNDYEGRRLHEPDTRIVIDYIPEQEVICDMVAILFSA